MVCVGSPINIEGSCDGDSGSPVIKIVSQTARNTYFEQVFLVSGGISCKFEAQIYTRINNRKILTWIRRAAGTQKTSFLPVWNHCKTVVFIRVLGVANPIMVVGGYNSDVPNGLLDDVEVISPKEGNVCTKRVSPTGPAERCFNIDGNVECEAASLGMTGKPPLEISLDA